jgi:uncharacterized membrane protein
VIFNAARSALLVMAAASAAATLYVGAYQIRAVRVLKCPLFRHGCEAVADAPSARPWGIPDGFLAAGLYAMLMVLAVVDRHTGWLHFVTRGLAILAMLANIVGVYDMYRLGSFCFYCVLTTVLSPFLVWMAFWI